MTANDLQTRMRAMANAEKAAVLQRFFKTGPGEYGEGDVMLGIQLPDLRKLVREFRALPLAEVDRLLQSEFHEERLVGLLILAEQFRKADDAAQKKIFDFYLARTDRINNWDLVDCSAHLIVGPFLEGRNRARLVRLAKSTHLFERRIAMLATLHYIRKNDFTDALALAELLLGDREDLMHKAVGWMLREIGKRDVATLERFLTKHAAVMPRTMLRYAIERFPEPERKAWLHYGNPRQKRGNSHV